MLPAKPFRDYTAEEVLKLAAQCTWPSRKYRNEEFEDHCRDWLEDIGRMVSSEEYRLLEQHLVGSPRRNIFYYWYQGRREQFGIMQDVKLSGKKFRKTG